MRRLVWLIDAYGTGVLLLLALRVVIGERWDVIALANTFLPFVLAPCVVLALLRLRWRRRVLSWLNALPALVLLFHYTPSLIPRPSLPNAEALTILSYNVRGGRGQEATIETVLRDAHADLVLLQDLHPDAAETLETMFASEYPHSVFRIADRRGWMIMSRLAFETEPVYSAENGYLRADVLFDGRRMRIYNVHLFSPNTVDGFDFTTRARQLDALLVDAANSTQPTVMMGDFNFSEFSDPYTRVATRLRDAHRERGWGLGFTRDVAGEIPIARIDFAFYSANLQAVDFQTSASSYGSDHRPIVAVFELE